ncbi:MAG: 5-formyltetrahydrofolate cyclo-ligase [Pseudomonadota bacterium]
MKPADNDNMSGWTESEYASSPCLMHRLDPLTGAVLPDVDRQQQIDVMRWRKAERQRLIALRQAIPAAQRRELSGRIARSLDDALDDVRGRIASFYWPFRGEPDLRPWAEAVAARGGTCALPVVVGRHEPLVFRPWRKGDPLEPGVWNIPVPATEVSVTPDIVVAPAVGFDPACYRLGYGGGFFDRTLAALQRRPRVIGVAFAVQAIRTIFPQPHDVPMDMIVTEAGVLTPADGTQRTA